MSHLYGFADLWCFGDGSCQCVKCKPLHPAELDRRRRAALDGVRKRSLLRALESGIALDPEPEQ